MDSEKTKIIPDRIVEIGPAQPLPRLVIDPFVADELAEEIWLTGNKDDAACILETFGHNLTDYAFKLLCDIIFGIETPIEYAPQKFTITEKIHHLLNRILL